MTITKSTSSEIEGWVRLAVDGADEKLANNIDPFFVGEILGITDWFVVASGATARQVRAIVEGVEEMVFLGDGPKPLRIEGLDTGEWVLMDYGAFIVHVFTNEAREFYELERLWSDAPRLGAVERDAADSETADSDTADSDSVESSDEESDAS